eukprot:2958130-Pleurochrysis_carterae.AAC.1
MEAEAATEAVAAMEVEAAMDASLLCGHTEITETDNGTDNLRRKTKTWKYLGSREGKRKAEMAAGCEASRR